MTWIAVSLITQLLLSGLIGRALSDGQGPRGMRALRLYLAGAFLAFPVRLVSAYILDSIGWSLVVEHNRSLNMTALGAGAVMVAVEQLALAVTVWPAYREHRLERGRVAWATVAMSASGFSAAYAVMETVLAPTSTVAFAALGAHLSRVFASGIWAICLATSNARFKPWIPLAWCLAVAGDGFFRHLLQGRGAGWQVVTLPALLCMLVIVLLAARRASASARKAPLPLVRALALGEPPGLDTVRAAFQHAHRPALIHWVIGGALVSFGASLVGLAAGVMLAHALQIDLSWVDETNAKAAIPLLVLGCCVLLSFPISGFLTAKASAADSLFEPGMAALLSIAALTALLARSAPATLVLGLALSPLAFALACFGAWLGLVPKGKQQA